MQQRPDPDTADVEEIRAYCGIKPHAPKELVPVEAFRQNGDVRCSRTGATPEPPFTVIANYRLQDDEREVMSNEAYADYVAEHTDLTDAQANVYAYLVAGYSHDETGDAIGRARGTVASHADRINKKLQNARQTAAVLGDLS